MAGRFTSVHIVWALVLFAFFGLGQSALAADTDSHIVTMTIPARSSVQAPDALHVSVASTDFIMETGQATIYRSMGGLRYGTNDSGGQGYNVMVSVDEVPRGMTIRAHATAVGPAGAWSGSGCGRASGGRSLSTTPVSIIENVRAAGCEASVQYAITVDMTVDPGTYRMTFHWTMLDR